MVRIRLKLMGLPALADRLGGREALVDFPGSTVGALARWLQEAHGDPAGVRLLVGEGRLEPSLQVLRNGGVVPGDELDRPLAPGDEVTLLVIVAGG